MLFTEYMIADVNKKRSRQLQEKLDAYAKFQCVAIVTKERDLMRKMKHKQPELVLVYVGESRLNAFSIMDFIRIFASKTKVVFYSENRDYAIAAFESGADYFIPLPFDEIQIGKFAFRCINQIKRINQWVDFAQEKQ
ncbi:response regulator [Sinanaerobacter chloroacetimidivorans]|uniref:Stage 0 sporulation protein A homolog n=1 Tax=Sinanaerobacter chloroacetimidivorans TaxID=2818044 RepID=A0A8J7W2Q2_9FIRM|nr:response regulator [Sinanaerobacter chloroacetimidivorans]MBR0599802.1 hypothetical protein [Sinanaerobacter chloroacetimidivorans]